MSFDADPVDMGYSSLDESIPDVSVKHLRLLDCESASEMSDDISVSDESYCFYYNYKTRFCGSLISEGVPKFDSDILSCGSSSGLASKVWSRANSFSSNFSTGSNDTFFRASQDRAVSAEAWNDADARQIEHIRTDVHNSLLTPEHIVNLCHKLRAAEAAIQELREESLLRDNQLHALRNETETLKQKLVEELEKKSELRSNLLLLQEEHESLKLESKLLQEVSAESAEVNTNLNLQLQRVCKENHKLSSALTELETTIAQRGRQIFELEKVNRGLVEQLHGVMGAHKSAHVSIGEHSEQEEPLQGIIEEKESELINTTKEWWQEKHTQEGNEEKIAEPAKPAKINLIDEGERTYKVRVAELESLVQTLLDELKLLHSSDSESEPFASEFIVQKADIMMKLEESQNENKAARESMDELVEHIQALTTTVDSQLSAKISLERRATTLQSEKDNLEAHVADMEEENLQLLEKIEELETQLRWIKREREESVMSLCHLQNDLEQHRESKEQIKRAEDVLNQMQELSVLKSELSARSDALYRETMRAKEALTEMQKERIASLSVLKDEVKMLTEQLSSCSHEKAVFASRCSLLLDETKRLESSMHAKWTFLENELSYRSNAEAARGKQAEEALIHLQQECISALTLLQDELRQLLDQLSANVDENKLLLAEKERLGASLHDMQETINAQEENWSSSDRRVGVKMENIGKGLCELRKFQSYALENQLNAYKLQTEELQQFTEQQSCTLDEFNGGVDLLRINAVHSKQFTEKSEEALTQMQEELSTSQNELFSTSDVLALPKMQKKFFMLQNELYSSSDEVHGEAVPSVQTKDAWIQIQEKLSTLEGELFSRTDALHAEAMREDQADETSIQMQRDLSMLQTKLPSQSNALHGETTQLKQPEVLVHMQQENTAFASLSQKDLWQLREQLSTALNDDTTFISRYSFLSAENDRALRGDMEQVINTQEEMWPLSERRQSFQMENMERELDEVNELHSFTFESQHMKQALQEELSTLQNKLPDASDAEATQAHQAEEELLHMQQERVSSLYFLQDRLQQLENEVISRSVAFHVEAIRAKQAEEALIELQQESSSSLSLLQDELQQLTEQLSGRLDENAMLGSQCLLLSVEKERLEASLNDMEQLMKLKEEKRSSSEGRLRVEIENMTKELHKLEEWHLSTLESQRQDLEQVMKAKEEKWSSYEVRFRVEMDNMAKELDEIKGWHFSILESKQVEMTEKERLTVSLHDLELVMEDSEKGHEKCTFLENELSSRSVALNVESMRAKQAEMQLIQMQLESSSLVSLLQDKLQRLTEQLSALSDENAELVFHCSLQSSERERLLTLVHNMEQLLQAQGEKWSSSERRLCAEMEVMTGEMNEVKKRCLSSFESQDVENAHETLIQMEEVLTTPKYELLSRSSAQVQEKFAVEKEISSWLDVVCVEDSQVTQVEKGILCALESQQMEKFDKAQMQMQERFTLENQLSFRSNMLHGLQVEHVEKWENFSLLPVLQDEFHLLTEQLSASVSEKAILALWCLMLSAEKERVSASLHDLEEQLRAQEEECTFLKDKLSSRSTAVHVETMRSKRAGEALFEMQKESSSLLSLVQDELQQLKEQLSVFSDENGEFVSQCSLLATEKERLGNLPYVMEQLMQAQEEMWSSSEKRLRGEMEEMARELDELREWQHMMKAEEEKWCSSEKSLRAEIKNMSRELDEHKVQHLSTLQHQQVQFGENQGLARTQRENWSSSKRRLRVEMEERARELIEVKEGHLSTLECQNVGSVEETVTKILEEFSALQNKLSSRSDEPHTEDIQWKHVESGFDHMEQEVISSLSVMQGELQHSNRVGENTMLNTRSLLCIAERQGLGASLEATEELVKAQEEKWASSGRRSRLEMGKTAKELGEWQLYWSTLENKHVEKAKEMPTKMQLLSAPMMELLSKSDALCSEMTLGQAEAYMEEKHSSLQIQLFSKSDALNAEAIQAKQVDKALINTKQDRTLSLSHLENEPHKLTKQLSTSYDENAMLASQCLFLLAEKERLEALLYDREESVKAEKEKPFSLQRRLMVELSTSYDENRLFASQCLFLLAEKERREALLSEREESVKAEEEELSSLQRIVVEMETMERELHELKESQSYTVQNQMKTLQEEMTGEKLRIELLEGIVLILKGEAKAFAIEIPILIRNKGNSKNRECKLDQEYKKHFLKLRGCLEGALVCFQSLRERQCEVKADEWYSPMLSGQVGYELAKQVSANYEFEKMIDCMEEKLFNKMDAFSRCENMAENLNGAHFTINCGCSSFIPVEILKLMERIDYLEREVMMKEKEIERFQEEFLARSADLEEKIEFLELSNEQLAGQVIDDTEVEQLKHELIHLQSRNSSLARREIELLSRLRTEKVLQEEIGRLQEENNDLVGHLERFIETAKNPFLIEKIIYLETELSKSLETISSYKTLLRSTQQNANLASLGDLDDLEQVLNNHFEYKRKAT